MTPWDRSHSSSGLIAPSVGGRRRLVANTRKNAATRAAHVGDAQALGVQPPAQPAIWLTLYSLDDGV